MQPPRPADATRRLHFVRVSALSLALAASPMVSSTLRADEEPKATESKVVETNETEKSPESPWRTAESERPAPRNSASNFDRLHSVVRELKLNDAEQTKVEEQFTRARKRLDEWKAKPDAGQDSRKTTAKISDDLREGINSVLTAANKQELRERMAKLSNDLGAARGGPITTLRENLQQVGLTDGQRDKVQDCILELRDKIGAGIKAAGKDSQARSKAIRDATEECRQKIIDLLTDEQRAKLNTLTKNQRNERD